MKNTHSLIFALQLFVPINDFEVFDVGSNKKKVNLANIEFTIAKNLPNRIRTLGEFLDSEFVSSVSSVPSSVVASSTSVPSSVVASSTSTPASVSSSVVSSKRISPKVASSKINSVKIHLAIPGFILETLKKNHPSDFALLKEIVLKHNVEFLLSTYYNTSLKISSDLDLAGQLLQEKHFIKKNFAQKAELFFTNDHHLSKKVSLALKRSKVKGIVFANNSKVSLLHYTNTSLPVLDLPKGKSKIINHMHVYSFLQLGNENIRNEIKELVFAKGKGKNNFVSCKSIFSKETSQIVLHEKKDLTSGVESDLQKHLSSELQMMYPYVLKTGDEELLQTWRLLANKELISYANPQLSSQDHNPYEYYANVMNILNDMAHTIVSVENVRRGKPQMSATIYPSPSAFIQEQLFNNQMSKNELNALSENELNALSLDELNALSLDESNKGDLL